MCSQIIERTTQIVETDSELSGMSSAVGCDGHCVRKMHSTESDVGGFVQGVFEYSQGIVLCLVVVIGGGGGSE